jgi:hypothetical protein
MQATTATTPATPSFDAPTARRALTRTVVSTILGTAAALACVTFLVARPDWWRGYTAATIASALAAGLSLIPLHKGLSKGFSAFIPAVMVATGVRTAVAVGGCVLAVLAGNYPPVPTFVLMMPYYLALLAAETAFLVKLGKK